MKTFKIVQWESNIAMHSENLNEWFSLTSTGYNVIDHSVTDAPIWCQKSHSFRIGVPWITNFLWYMQTAYLEKSMPYIKNNAIFGDNILESPYRYLQNSNLNYTLTDDKKIEKQIGESELSFQSNNIVVDILSLKSWKSICLSHSKRFLMLQLIFERSVLLMTIFCLSCECVLWRCFSWILLRNKLWVTFKV